MAGMVVIGIDAHKQSYTAVAVDEVGRKLAQCTLRADADGHLELLGWASQWAEVRFAIEDCRQVSRRLEQDLVRRGHAVVRVAPGLMAGARRSARERGKSDPIDAAAVAAAALREPRLPVARLDDATREVKLLSDHRHDLVVERTRLASRLRWHLHELDPSLDVPARGLRRGVVLDRVAAVLEPLEGVVARIARELVTRCRQLNAEIAALERELAVRVRRLAPSLLAVPGCGTLTAAVLLGETADPTRFHSRAAFARFNGTAPVPVWSGHERLRLSRGGNRTVNCALHTIALTQAAGHGTGAAYVERLMSAGKTRREALRVLRRRISDRVLAAMRTDHLARTA